MITPLKRQDRAARASASPARSSWTELSYVALEPRIAFDAAAAATVTDASHHDAHVDAKVGAAPATSDLAKDLSVALGTPEPAQNLVTAAQPAATVSPSDPVMESARRHELVFVASDADDVQQWLDDLNKNSDGTRQFEVITLDATRDGLEQITQALAGHNDVDAIHVLSHGVAGAIKLGDVWLTQDNLSQYQYALQSWQSALSADADILFYGCDVAGNVAGQQLLSGISQLTGADVNASTDNTGNILFGGDWNLEYATGSIETRLAVSQALQQEWMHLLNATVDNTSSGSVDGALSLTISHSTSGTDRLMLVAIGYDPHGTTITSVTYNGVALSLVGSEYQAGTHSSVEIWSLVAPSNGNHDVVVTMSDTAYHGLVAGVVTFNGVDQTSPLASFRANSGDSSTASVTVPSTTDDLVFSVVHSHDGSFAAPGAGQTEYWDLAVSNTNSSGATEAGAPSVITSWAVQLDDWSVAGVSVQSLTNAPIISNLGSDELRYTAGGGPIVIDQGSNTTVTDNDSADFDTGVLTVSLVAGSDASEDVLAIRNQGTAAGQIGVSGSNITYGGVTIGTFTGGSGGTDLAITLNANANPTSTAALIQNITFQNTDGVSPTLGERTVRFVLSDGDGGISSNYDTTVTMDPVTQSSGLWVSSVTGATSSSGITWSDSAAVRFGDPDLALEPGTTSGTFAQAFDLDTFAGDGNAKLRGLYIVRSDITVGSGLNTVALQTGDVLFSTKENETFGGIAGTNEDLWLFRPIATNDYSAGTFSILLDSPTGNHVRDITLVESTITVGGITLNPGDFLINQEGSDQDIWRFQATGVGSGTTAGSFSLFFDGSDVGFSHAIGGMELVNQITTLGDTTLQPGQIILNMADNDTVGSNALAVTKFDLFVLNITQAGSTSVATASLLFEGADVGLTAGGEEFDAVALMDVNHAPVLTGANNLTTIVEDPVSNPGTLLSSIVSGRITDTDSGATTGVAVTAVDSTNGTWQWSANAGVTWNAFGSPDASNARLLIADSNTYVRFVPNADFSGTVSNGFTFRAWDQTSGTPGLTADVSVNGGATAFSAASASAGITVTAVNDAPVLANTALTLTVAEDAGVPSGAVGSLIGAFTGGISDVDSGAVKGIAIVASDETRGTWYYSTDSGASWTAIGSVSAAASLLLADDGSTRLYFAPAADYNGPAAAALTVRAWDRSSGANGGVADTSSNGGTTAFSTATDVVDVTVTAVNDAPVLANTALTLTVAEDAGTPSGAVGSLVGAFTSGISDVDSGAIKGIAIVASDETRGTWYYSTNNGVSWTAVGSVSAASSLLLADDGNSRLYFAPVANYSGPAAAALTIRGWDQTSGTSGATANTSSNGGSTAFSSATDVIDVTVSAVNDAPVLDSTRSPVLATQNEDSGAPVGAVGTLVSALVDFASPAGQVDNVTDADSGALLGIAVIAADTSNGVWHYSTNGGASWNALGAVSDGTARLLAADANTRLYFQPNTDFNGTLANAIAFRAWDRTSGANGGVADASSNGGTTAFSSASDVAVLTITAVNDAPVLANTALTLTVAEDAGIPSGAVGSLVGAFTGGISDVDAGAVRGIAIVASDESRGTWYYSTNNGASWTAVGSVSAAASLLLADDGSTRLYFAPAADYNGPAAAALTVRAWDRSSGTNGATADSTSNGGTTAFSSATDVVDVTVTAVNDAPVLANTALTLTVAEDAGVPSGAVGSLVGAFTGGISDVDSGAVKGIAIVASDETRGSWYYSTNNGASWTAVGSVSAASSLLLADDGNSRLYFAPVADTNGPAAAALTIRGWDQTSGANGGVADASSNGGTTAFSSATDVIDVTVTAVNDAPVLADTALSLTVAEDAGIPSGAVGSLVGAFTGGISDVDSGAVKGIAIVASDESRGTWYYSTNNGASWAVVGSVSAASSLLLADDGSTRLYFAPVADTNGPAAAALTIRAWDRSSGTNGATADSTSNGGTTAFSSATDVIDVTVTAVNDAPVLANTALTLTVAEDAGVPSGAVGSLVGAFTGGISDVDAGAVKGIAIVASDESRGTWYYSTNNGASWAVVGSVSGASSLLLADDGSTRLYFAPAADYNGPATAALTIRGWDQTSGANGSVANTTSNGGTTAFSSATDVVDVTVTAVNDAPVLADTALSLTVAEDGGAPFGAVGSLVSAFTGGISDIDAGSVRGIAIVASDESRGTWYYSTNNGASWTAVGSVSAASSRLLADDGSTRLHFVSATNYNGPAAAALTIRAWDRTSGTNGALADTSSNGGTTAFSSATDVVDVTVTAVNDAPTIAGGVIVVLPATDDVTASGATTVDRILTAASWADVDAGAMNGIAITGKTGNGTWQYSTDGTTWTNFGSVSDTNALLVNSGTALRFVPAGGPTTAQIAFVAWDQTAGVASSDGAPSHADTTSGGTAFSSQSANARVAVTITPQPPVLPTPTPEPLPVITPTPISDPTPTTDPAVQRRSTPAVILVNDDRNVAVVVTAKPNEPPPQPEAAPQPEAPAMELPRVPTMVLRSDPPPTPPPAPVLFTQVAFLEDLDKGLADLRDPDQSSQVVLSQVMAGTSFAISAGYVGWVLRGTSLVSALLSSVPVWQTFDPLTVLVKPKKDDKKREDNSVVERMFDNTSAA